MSDRPPHSPESGARAPAWQQELDAARRALPDAPGIYKYFDAEGAIIYVGKALSLRKRVGSYFTKSGHDFKTRTLVRQIRRIETTVTRDDLEALLLENNLIKQHQPKYNLMLKDGKSYPFICLKHERFPRVFPTRLRVKDGSQYFGPYASVATMNAILNFLRETFKLRTCNLVLSERNIAEGKFRPCLEFHIGRCLAPCVGKQSQADYDEDVRQIRQLLRGNYRPLLEDLREQMHTAATALDYERAHYLKRRIEQINKLRRRSVVVSDAVGDVEVLTVLRRVPAEGADEARQPLAAVNHFRVMNGVLVQTHSYEVRPRLDETEADILVAALSLLVAEEEDVARRVLTNVAGLSAELTAAFAGFSFRVPDRGEELKLVQMALDNGNALLDEKLNISRLRATTNPTQKLLEQVKADLRLPRLPRHIECFDNSHIQGYAPVSSCVVFREGRAAKRDYRVYNTQTVQGVDDFQAMREVVFRRYRRLLDEAQPLPDLVLIDGGKGQLSAALESIRALGIDERVTTVAIAKRLEELYYKDDPVPLYIDKKSPTLRLLQRIRNEAHNTAINYHRKRRDAKTLRTELTEIPGVGPATTRKLLTELRTVKAIREAELPVLAAIVGEAKAQAVHDYYRSAEQLTLAQEPVAPDGSDANATALSAADAQRAPAPEPRPPRKGRLPKNPLKGKK